VATPDLHHVDTTPQRVSEKTGIRRSNFFEMNGVVSSPGESSTRVIGFQSTLNVSKIRWQPLMYGARTDYISICNLKADQGQGGTEHKLQKQTSKELI
jgi:hypothetical protein